MYLVTGVLRPLWPAAVLEAVLLPAAVTLLPLLHHSVPADGHLGLLEAALVPAGLGLQYLVDAREAAGGELLVVDLVSRGGSAPINQSIYEIY